MNMTKHDKANDVKWSKRSTTYDNKRFNYFRFMQRHLIISLKLKANSNFLDLGCGTGWAVYYASKICNEAGSFIGIDISDGMIKKAKQNYSYLKNVDFFHANSESLPFKNNYFDFIICTNSFHHYSDPNKALLEVFRVLNKQGKFYILDVTSDDFFMKFIDKIVQKREKEHVKFYSKKEYIEMFNKNGLKHIKSKAFIYPMKIHIAEK